MKLRYWIIGFVFLLGGLGLVTMLKNPFHSVGTEKPVGEKLLHDEHSEKQNHDEHKHDHGQEKEDPHDDHKHDHGKEEEGHDDHEESEEESMGGVGKNNAVTAADEHDGIRLSSKALDAMHIKTAAYKNGLIPVQALVRYQGNLGVYRLRDDWFKLIPVQVKSLQGDFVAVITDELGVADQIVIVGTGLVRAAELDAFSTEVGHGH